MKSGNIDKLYKWIINNYKGYGKFSFVLNSNHQPILYNTLYAVLALYHINKLKDINSNTLEDIKEYVLSKQSKDSGFFFDEDVTYISSKHSQEYTQWHTTFCALQVLELIDTKPIYYFNFLNDYDTKDKLKNWLESLNKKESWNSSNKIMAILSLFFYEWKKTNNPQWIDLYKNILSWLDDTQDSLTGYWGTNNGASKVNGMAATYHYLMFYYAINREINYIEEIIDSTLSLQHDNGHFSPLGGGSCIDLDAADILINLSYITDYRNKDIYEATHKLKYSILSSQNEDGGFAESYYTNKSIINYIKSIKYIIGFSCRGTQKWNFKQIVKHIFNVKARFGSLEQQLCLMQDSNMWAAWFRPMTVSIILNRYSKTDQQYNYLTTPGLGYTGGSLHE